MIGTRVAFRGAFGPHEGIVLEETDDSVILKVEKNDTLGNRGQVTLSVLCLDCETISNEMRHKCSKRAGSPLVSLSTILNRTSDPRGCALGAQRDFRVGRTVGSLTTSGAC
jgi:hypothetical protein